MTKTTKKEKYGGDKDLDNNEESTSGIEWDTNTNEEMELSSAVESSSMGSQQDMESEMENSHTYVVPPFPDASSKNTENSG